MSLRSRAFCAIRTLAIVPCATVLILTMAGVSPAAAETGTVSWGEAKWPSGATTCWAVEQVAGDVIVASFGHPTSSGIYRSYDEGVTWEPVAVAAVGTYYVNDISFADSRNGFAVGMHQDGPQTQSLILKTTDGGRSWSRVDGASGTAEPSLRAVDFDSPSHAVAVTTAGIVYTLEPNGTWQLRPISGTPELRDVAVTHQGDDLVGAIVGDDGRLWRISRTPSSWAFAELTDVPSLGSNDLWGVADRSTSGGFVAVGDGAFQLNATNWGWDWSRGTAISSGAMFSQDYYSVDFSDSQNGLAVGERVLISNGNRGKALRMTFDGGSTWANETLPDGGSTVLTGASMSWGAEACAHSNDRVYHRARPSLERYAGADRYQTAYNINKYSFEVPYGNWAVLATGKDFPDALCAAGLAGVMNAPVLIVRDTLSDLQLLQLKMLGVDAAYIVGGSGAIPTAVGGQLTSAGIQWQRIAGADRYETAKTVADKIKFQHDARGELSDYCFVARGDMFPDALALSPFAYSQGLPILLTKPTSLPAPIAQCIDTNGYEYGWLAGGTGAVSDDVKKLIDFKLISNGGSWLVRQSGATRYETAALLADEGIAATWATGGYFGIATGLNFPDALVGGAVAGAKSGTLLLTQPNTLPAVAEACIADNTRYDTDIRIYGGTDVVSESVGAKLGTLLP